MNVSEANDCNYPYKLQWSNSCALTDPLGVASLAELYLDIEFSGWITNSKKRRWTMAMVA